MREPLRYDHYLVLGIPRDASPLSVKQAYRERVKMCHPDRNGSPEATALFHAVHAAYETLRDAESRRAYDERLAHHHHHVQQRSTASARSTPRYTKRNDPPMNRFAFIGLHLTGLCFGVGLISGILVGITLLEWPSYTVALTIPGAVVIPDSLAGLRRK